MMNTTYWVLLGLVVVIPGIISMFFPGFSFDPRKWRRRMAPARTLGRRHDDRHNIG
jgi:uncharacterized protein YjeT (DUF2065 family)